MYYRNRYIVKSWRDDEDENEEGRMHKDSLAAELISRGSKGTQVLNYHPRHKIIEDYALPSHMEEHPTLGNR